MVIQESIREEFNKLCINAKHRLYAASNKG